MEYKMDIRSDLVKSAVLEYIDETFANMEFNISNAGSLVIAKIFVDKHYDQFAKLLADENGNIPISLFEQYASDAMNKLKVVEIPKLGGKLLFKQEDFIKLMNKIKSKGAVQ